MAAAATLPRWDMQVIFPSLDSPEYLRAFEEFKERLAKLEAFFDRNGIDKGAPATAAASVFDEVVPMVNELMERGRTLNAYIGAFVTTNSRDDLAQARGSEMDQELARTRKLNKRLTGWIGSQDVSTLLAQSALARENEYMIHKAVEQARHMMSSVEESLANDLELTGKSAWSKLHSNITSQITVPVRVSGETRTLPMSAVRALAHDPDRDNRKAAYDAEVAGWKQNEVPLAAAMNSIKGEVSLLCKKRGWNEPLDEALFGANIDRQTLDAMMTAARESFPDFRRYLQAKARALRLPKLAWYDIFAPLGSSEPTWEYDRATSFVVEQFGTYSQKLADYAARTFAENWIDVPPAPGKVDGAYCMGIRADESRILMNYEPSFGSVSTLAHELGHGYHNYCLAERTWLQRATPMTLAETASIFCETIIREAVLENGSPEEQRVVLEASLQGSCQVVVDITSRFLFESSVFNQRAKRELSATEMCDLMLQAQKDTYGDGIDQGHPYMWAVKGHYYSGRSYYNFPYMFGLLFGLGLYSIYKREPAGFHGRYDELLSSTGLADAATLGKGFGIDIRSVDFWRGSLDQVRADVDRFEKLVS
jgi:oligoendopeptidase F